MYRDTVTLSEVLALMGIVAILSFLVGMVAC